MSRALAKADLPQQQQQGQTMFDVSSMARMAEAICRSNLFGMSSPDQVLALMLIAQAEGLHPATAARDYNIIKGRPALKADAMLARFQQSGGRVEWREVSDSRCEAVFTHPAGGSVSMDWDIERAQVAGVIAKNPAWKAYPRAMLRARVISEGIRTVYPAVIAGVYTPEEIQDITPSLQPAPSRPTSPAPASAQSQAQSPAQTQTQTQAPAGISEQQKKLLEARIAEYGLDRERVKSWVTNATKGRVTTFADMSIADFDRLMRKLPQMAEQAAADEAQKEREAIQGEAAHEPDDYEAEFDTDGIPF